MPDTGITKSPQAGPWDRPSVNPIDNALRAGLPLIGVTSPDEERVVAAVEQSCRRSNRQLWLHTISKGLWTVTFNGSAGEGLRTVHEKPERRLRDPLALLEYIRDLHIPSRGAVYLLLDFFECLHDPLVRRHVRDLSVTLKRSKGSVIITATQTTLPPSLEAEVCLIEFPPPSSEELVRHVEDFAVAMQNRGARMCFQAGYTPEKVAKLGTGLSQNLFEICLASAVASRKGMIDDVFMDELRRIRQEMINRSGFLDLVAVDNDRNRLGGLAAFKDWLYQRRNGFTAQAHSFGLPAPRGVLLLGVPGCGKSLAARTVAILWGLPLLRLDTGRLFTSRVGGSEKRTRQVIATAESLAPCVLWIDELEKAMSGLDGSGDSDAGTAARVFAVLATWLQEKKAPVFVLATANNVAGLPSEMTRRGRWDEIFFIDLPGLGEREEIFAIHLFRYRQDAEAFDLRLLAEHSRGFSGAEIEQAVIDALYQAFDAQRPLTDDDLLTALDRQIPLSVSRQEDIQALREWSVSRARSASRDEIQSRRCLWNQADAGNIRFLAENRGGGP